MGIRYAFGNWFEAAPVRSTPACAGKSPPSTRYGWWKWKYPRVRGEESGFLWPAQGDAEIPPRARGRVCWSPISAPNCGNTPACAGKSQRSRSYARCTWKYPRVRGEESARISTHVLYVEIPPRARGRAQRADSSARRSGNTPACAGKSFDRGVVCCTDRKYPRVRGEEKLILQARREGAEIPPRARGRDCGRHRILRRQGNTPACAGKRRWSGMTATRHWKYPRVRGEEGLKPSTLKRGVEIPPRARGRVEPATSFTTSLGNTPACAGKSELSVPQQTAPRKYPRVRGEEKVDTFQLVHVREIPPRARGRAHVGCCGLYLRGNTPACAGKSDHLIHKSTLKRKYPRVRGEETFPSWPLNARVEIPPRARGRAAGARQWCLRAGNTPACAGKRHRLPFSDFLLRKYPRVRGEEMTCSCKSLSDPEIPPRARGRGSVIHRDR